MTSAGTGAARRRGLKRARRARRWWVALLASLCAGGTAFADEAPSEREFAVALERKLAVAGAGLELPSPGARDLFEPRIVLDAKGGLVKLDLVDPALVPLETTSQVAFEFDLLDRLPREFTRAGKILRPMIAHAFRAQRQLLGREGILLHDVAALVAVTNPELFERQSVMADVETVGELTAGMLVVDRRRQLGWRPNADLLVGCDPAAVQDCVLRGLAAAGEAT